MSSGWAKISLVLVAIIWGSGFIATQMALDAGVTPFYMMTCRFSIAAIVLACICTRALRKDFMRHLVPGIVLGLFMYLAFAFQTIGLQYTTPFKNAFLTSTNVIIAPFIFWVIFTHPPKISVFIGTFVAMVGIGFISINMTELVSNFRAINLGDGLTLACAFFFACHIVYIGYYTFHKNLDPIKLVILQMGTAAILSVISTLLFEEYSIVLSFKAVGSILHLGIFSTLVAFLLQNIAQKYVPATTAAIILSTESLFAALLSVLILKEQMTLQLIVGGLLVLGAVIITETQFLERLFVRKGEL